jgi:hypothetical protein
MSLTLVSCITQQATQLPHSAALAVPTAVDRIAAFNLAVRDYPALFEGLTGDHLRDLERAGNEDSPSDHIEQLLPVLDDWERRLDAFDGTLSARDLSNIMACGANSPTGIAYRQAAVSRDTYLRCRDTAHSAWVNWSFTGIDLDDEADARTGDDTGTPEVDDTEPVPCILDDCDGYGHPDDCTRRIAEISVGDLEVSTELVAPSEGKPYISIFGMRDWDEAVNVRAYTQADLDQIAADFTRVAAMIRQAGANLPHASVVEPEQGVCARCERTWPEPDLSADPNGDLVCCDCHASDPGDDRAQYRSYQYAGR